MTATEHLLSATENSIAPGIDEATFLNREISWLRFNRRVLEEAQNPEHPLLERLRFLSISAKNLDEFDMVRVAGLKEQLRAGITRKSQDGLTPQEQLNEISTEASDLIYDQQAEWKLLLQHLDKAKISIRKPDQLLPEMLEEMGTIFDKDIFPVLTPLAIDPVHPFPFIENKGFAIALSLTHKNNHNAMMALVPIPTHVSRFVELATKAATSVYLAVEDVIAYYVSKLFPGFEALSVCAFRVIRDSDIEIEEEAEDLIREFELLLKQRRKGRIVRLTLDASAPQELQQFITDHIGVERSDVISHDGLIGLAQIDQLIDKTRHDLLFDEYLPRYPERVRENGGDCFAAIRQKDFLVHHPYESFDVVERFLKQAAIDPQVVAIKHALYRTSEDSPIIAALIEAAENGKSVTALVEIKARFDEEANIKWARNLERAGVKVVFGLVQLKTHAKLSLIIRKEETGLRAYGHFGTGNYHPLTAKIYTDLSLFSDDPALCRDAGRAFNYVTSYAEADAFEKLALSPISLRQSLMDHIDNEIKSAKNNQPAAIWAKMNSLVDAGVIEKLYEASMAGVQIELIIRGICCLKPGIKGLSENIRVKSIVGRFLEHSRIVCFGNGHSLPNENARIYLSSADWMPRNLNRRIETLVPIENETVKAQILDQIMVANINDDTQSWVMDENGHYTRSKQKHSDGFSAHEYFMKNPSLSGRGRALKESLPPRLRPRV